MTCDTIIKIDPDGTKHYKAKVVYETLNAAVLEAKKRNSEENRQQKLVAYKCSNCFKYHIGRNGKLITNKEKLKYRKELNIGVKVVGKIDLITLEPIQKMKFVGWIDLDKIRY